MAISRVEKTTWFSSVKYKSSLTWILFFLFVNCNKDHIDSSYIYTQPQQITLKTQALSHMHKWTRRKKKQSKITWNSLAFSSSRQIRETSTVEPQSGRIVAYLCTPCLSLLVVWGIGKVFFHFSIQLLQNAQNLTKKSKFQQLDF